MDSYKKKSSILTYPIDGETDWYYYPTPDTIRGDEPWQIITRCWEDHKNKYFKNLPLSRRDVIITAGAHVGLHVRFYASMFKRVYAFEPHPFSFWCMVNNAQSDNVIKMQCALGNEHKLINLDLSGTNGHLDYHISKNTDSAWIPMITIDSMNLDKCDMIQLDVENYEFETLIGARETINKYHPLIVMENGDTPEISQFMQGRDYRIDCKTAYDTIWIPGEM